MSEPRRDDPFLMARSEIDFRVGLNPPACPYWGRAACAVFRGRLTRWEASRWYEASGGRCDIGRPIASKSMRRKLRSCSGSVSGWSDRPGSREAWRQIGQRRVLRAGVPHFGRSPALAHSPVRFSPGGKRAFRLRPVHDGSLVAPIEQVGHGHTVCASSHIATHAVLPVPGRHCPKGPAAVQQ
jgi:hypothetical protein